MIALLLFTGAGIFFLSCNKNNDNKNGKARLSVYLTDDPARYDEVNIDIREVKINVSDSANEQWINIPIKQGIYNLLQFRNGLDTLLGTIELPAGRVSQMRLILGPNNTLKEGNQIHALQTPSAQQSGLKFKIQTVLDAGITYKLWIDFDAGRSIVKAGNSGKYILKPVIRTYTEAISGGIRGIVLPTAADAWVYAIRGTNDTVASAKPDGTTGIFLIKGIAPDTYKLGIDANNNYLDSVISPVNVTLGNVTNVGTVTLRQ